MLPVQITIRDMSSSPALESHIRQRIEKLTRFNGRITSCRVVIHVPQKHKHQGKLFNVRIDITVPGKELVITHKQNQDVYIAIRDAFNALLRQLEEHTQRNQGRIKAHETIMHGHVARLITQEGYGFIEGVDGNEYYFSTTNVSYPAFSQLMIGDAVEYTAILQGEGRQAQHIIKERNHTHSS
jgi:ribosomal subunit interface protein